MLALKLNQTHSQHFTLNLLQRISINVLYESETWLNKNIQTQPITPWGYIVHRKDRSDGRIGGGIAIICRNDWNDEMHIIYQ